MKFMKAMGLLAALATAPAALAQSGDPARPPDLSRYLKWGPLHVRPGIAIPQFGRDDNVRYCYDNERGCTPLSDFVVTVSPRLDGLFSLGSRTFVTFTERFDYSFYAHDGDPGYQTLNYGNNFLSGRIAVPLRRVSLWTDLAHNRIKERPLEQQNVRPTQRENRLGFGARLQFGWRTDLDLGFARSDWQFRVSEDQQFDRRDRVEDLARARARYLLAGRTRTTLEVSELHCALGAYERLAAEGIPCRIVSIPSWEIFDRQRCSTKVRYFLRALGGLPSKRALRSDGTNMSALRETS